MLSRRVAFSSAGTITFSIAIAPSFNEMAPKDVLSKGIRLYQEGQYEEALKAFDHAIHRNPKDKNLLDSRAAVLEKLDRLTDALKDSKKVIDLAPDSWQGYRRSALLFLQLGKLSASLKMVELAIERVKSTDTKRRAELEALREEILNAMKQSQCHFAKLPVELQTDIFSLVINGSNARMLALNLVCRSWRQVMLANPKFWRHLDLGQRSTQKMVDAWLERANGKLSSLRIGTGFAFCGRHNIFRKASRDMWSKLEELEVHNDPSKYLTPKSIQQLRLRSLAIDVSSVSLLREGLWEGLRSLEASAIRDLAIRVGEGARLKLDGLPFSRLTSLHLTGRFEYKPLFELIRRSTTLETLLVSYLGQNWTEFPEDEELNPIDLPHLRRFGLTGLFDPRAIQILNFPSLSAFKLEAGAERAGTICTTDLLSQNITCLTEIVFHCCIVPYRLLLLLFRNSDSLSTLKLSRCTVHVPEDINSMIEALCGGASDEGNHMSSPPLLCPKLQHLDLSSSSDLKAGPLVRLVKAHLANSSVPSGKEPSTAPVSSGHSQNTPLPILSLNVDDCPLIDPDALQWLRATVPSVSSKMKPVKMGRNKLCFSELSEASALEFEWSLRAKTDLVVYIA
ncbi:hypothetical protein ACEPAF_9368 [Sanghuangporus sanghuang]